MIPPSTPPSSSPSSPTDRRNVSLRTPLKSSRNRRPSAALLTPQSLVVPRALTDSNINVDHPSYLTPNRKPVSTRASNWRIRDDKSPPCDLHENEYPGSSPVTATPTKPSGPFTPQVTKRAQTPLHSNVANYALSNEARVRGSFTDPPPRRRAPRPQLNEDDYLDSNSIENADTADATINEVLHLGSPISAQVQYNDTSGPETTCASCGGNERLSLLQPCQHYICAPCITGSLNVVGEKDMICMNCFSPVQSFQIFRPFERIHSRKSAQTLSYPPLVYHNLPLKNSPNSFDSLYQFPPAQSGLQGSPISTSPQSASAAVLRIDNVPWDVTPPMLEQWLGTPTFICHVLLDRRDGRTLSHAFAEMEIDHAREALRTHQNKVLGYGRRSRAVTLTLSSQEELMRSLFPSWPGKFEGSQPFHEATLDAQQPPRPADLLTGPELGIMLHLIQAPKSHFLKLPSLAYWSLLSVLAKIPTPDVFAPGAVPDVLFNITFFALEKYESQVGSQGYEPLLHMKLIGGAMRCKAFTDRQLGLLLRFTNRPLPILQYKYPAGPELHVSNQQSPAPPAPQTTGLDDGSLKAINAYERVGQDFGIDPALVHALAERLVFHSTTTPGRY